MSLFFKSSFIILMMIGCANQGSDNGSHQYESIVKFKKNEIIQFPDFSLEFIGESTFETKPINGRSFHFLYHNFIIKNQGKEEKISWSSGTGDIGPRDFTFNSQKFQLELKIWEKNNNQLKENELVITKL